MALKTRLEDCLPKSDVLERPDYTEAEAQAIRALHRGEASSRQQKLASDFIMRASGFQDQSYRPGDPHKTAFCEGKRWVGLTWIWMIKAAPTRTDTDKIASRTIEDDKDGRREQR